MLSARQVVWLLTFQINNNAHYISEVQTANRIATIAISIVYFVYKSFFYICDKHNKPHTIAKKISLATPRLCYEGS